jgi:hypothetical protein
LLQKVSDDHVQKWVVRTFLGEKITNFQSSFVSPQKVTRFSWKFPAWGKWGVGETLMIRHFIRWSSLQKIEKLLFGCKICFGATVFRQHDSPVSQHFVD